MHKTAVADMGFSRGSGGSMDRKVSGPKKGPDFLKSEPLHY